MAGINIISPPQSQNSFMKNKIFNNQVLSKLPLKLIGQIIIVLIVFFFFDWLIKSLSFAKMNGLEPRSTAGVSSQEIFDNFGYKVYDVKWNESTWAEVGTGSHIEQLDGVLMLSREVEGFGGLAAYRRKWLLSQINYMESIIMLNSDIQTRDGDIGVEIDATINGNLWFAKCAIHGEQGKKTALILCDTADKFSITPVEVSYDTWHVVRFEVDAEKTAVTFFVDGQNAGKYIPQDTNGFKFAEYSLMLGGWSSRDGLISGSFDSVQLKTK
jgi:hypothetical protein